MDAAVKTIRAQNFASIVTTDNLYLNKRIVSPFAAKTQPDIDKLSLFVDRRRLSV